MSFVVFLIGYMVVVLIMGCFLDLRFIMLILLPFVLPVMDGFASTSFGSGIYGDRHRDRLLTPPLGVSVFVVRPISTNKAYDLAGVQGCRAVTLTMCGCARDLRPIPVAVAGADRANMDLVVSVSSRIVKWPVATRS